MPHIKVVQFEWHGSIFSEW